MKGIILSGGLATRLMPCTAVTSKQLLPVYNRPMIYYPLDTLIRAGIKDILIIVSRYNAGDYLNLLGSGMKFGVRLFYEIQERPEGIAHGIMISSSFIGDDNFTLALGDNIFEDDLSSHISGFESGAKIFVKKVDDPARYGVPVFDNDGRIRCVIEKPDIPPSEYAVTGLYVFDNKAVKFAKTITKSRRSEYEIVDVINKYAKNGELRHKEIKGAWVDAGTFDGLLEASLLVKNSINERMLI